MRRALVIAALVLAATACGGTSTGGAGDAGDALGYLAADSATVILISTDVDGEQWQEFYRRVVSRFEDDGERKSLDDYAAELAREARLDWEDELKPLLGNDIAIGIEGDAASLLGGDGETLITAALETRGGDIEAVLRKAGFEQAGEANGATLYRDEDEEQASFAVEDRVLVFSDDEQALRRALARHDSGGGLEQTAVDEALSELPDESLARAFGTLASLQAQDEFRRFADLPLVRALETWGLTVAFADGDASLDVSVRLDEDQVDEEDLPLVTGAESPEIVLRERELSGGNLNQSQTTAFLLRALRAGYPDSRFVKAADAIEEELGIDFEQEILRQFDGPSASYVSPDGRTFAARSEVRDPEALRAVLPRIAPHLPALVEGLQGLQSEGMALLFLFAPDAPAAAPMSGVKVDPPSTPDGFYRISGLTGEGPSELFFGLVGDLFVVASNEQRAREIAEADSVAAEGAQGAGVLRANLTRLEEAANALPFPIEGRELVASLEASTSELRARVRVKLD